MGELGRLLRVGEMLLLDMMRVEDGSTFGGFTLAVLDGFEWPDRGTDETWDWGAVAG